MEKDGDPQGWPSFGGQVSGTGFQEGLIPRRIPREEGRIPRIPGMKGEGNGEGNGE